jgi:hypothetical protein
MTDERADVLHVEVQPSCAPSNYSEPASNMEAQKWAAPQELLDPTFPTDLALP